MRALPFCCALLLGAACGTSEEVVTIGAQSVAIRACKLYDEPAPVCRHAPEGAAPLSQEPGGPVDHWFLVPRDGLFLDSQRMVRVGNRQWYEVTLADGVSGFVPVPLANPMPLPLKPAIDPIGAYARSRESTSERAGKGSAQFQVGLKIVTHFV